MNNLLIFLDSATNETENKIYLIKIIQNLVEN
jgi:hypothetical protein